MSCFTGDDIGSDHMSLHLLVNFKRPSVTAPKVSIRSLKNCDWQLFRNILFKYNAKLALYPDIFDEAVLDNKALEFESCIKEAFETACPLREVMRFPNSASMEVVDLIKLKRQARRLAQKDPAYKSVFYKLQRQVKTILKKERTIFQFDITFIFTFERNYRKMRIQKPAAQKSRDQTAPNQMHTSTLPLDCRLPKLHKITCTIDPVISFQSGTGSNFAAFLVKNNRL